MNFIKVLFLTSLLFSCKPKKQENTNKEKQPVTVTLQEKFQNTGHQIIYNMVQKVGNYKLLSTKKDVIYTYTYTTGDGKTDISNEKYLFNGELSYGNYIKHQRTLPQLKGNLEQGYDGNNYWLKNNKTEVNDPKALKRVKFSRPTNFYWFAMLQKLLDPGLNYEYIGRKTIHEINYEVVKVSFNSDQPSDIYQVYINPKTNLVDQFLFTVVDFGVIDTPLLMKVKYTEVDGLLIPSIRKYKKSTWEAEEDDKPWTHVTWTNIKFNNGFDKKDFTK